VSGKNKKYKGYLFVELVIGFTIFGILLASLGILLHGFAKFNLYQVVRQQCVAAAQAQLDSISATGQPVSENDFNRLWPKINVTIEQFEGIGQWKGLKLVRAKTSGMSFNSPVKVELSRYFKISETGKEQ
jgi:type II secretory pathway pseudopilin PulG